MIHAGTGHVQIAGDQRRQVVLAQEPPGRDGEPGVGGQGGDDRGDDPADEHAGQGADREGGQRPGGERDPAQVEQAGCERGRLERELLGDGQGLVARGEVRLVVPGEQHAEGSGGGGHHDRERHQLGERPAPPPEALGPGVAEGAGLELTGQHRRTDERPDQRGHGLQNETIGQKSVRCH